jgi:Domain of Unknown Function (DUF1080)
VVDHDHVKYFVNRKVVNEATDLNATETLLSQPGDRTAQVARPEATQSHRRNHMKNRIAMRQVFALTAVLIVATVVASAGLAQQTLSIPPHGKLKPLFNGQNFKGFETLLQKHGINNDPDKVFQVEDGALHISGQEFGGLVTKKEYENYYLRAEFKWGEKMYPPRLGKRGIAASSTTLPGLSKSGLA